jgi:hypothetical protein
VRCGNPQHKPQQRFRKIAAYRNRLQNRRQKSMWIATERQCRSRKCSAATEHLQPTEATAING